jgi:D-alanyl-D-alanine carboxypeptidase (penicillin-binding protein 5/6)
MLRVKKTRCFLLLSLILGLCLGVPTSVEAAPRINSQYYCVIDRDTGQPILGKNANTRRPMASTTKMMTAILALEYANLDDTAIVTKHADITPEYTIGLRAGQQLSVRELLKVALIRSANDAAVVLAEYIAGDEEFFAYLMSKKAFAIGAMQSNFKNASGLPDAEHYSTAYDLAIIGRYALSIPYLAKTVATAETEFNHPGYQTDLTIRNTNSLLRSYPGADGIKTGTTNAAGKCLVASASRENRGLIVVVLKSGDRQGDCVKLLDYGFKNTKSQKIIDREMAFESLKIINGEKDMAEIIPAQDLSMWLENTSNVEKKLRLNYNLVAPVKKGQVLGEIDIYVDGGYFSSVALVAQEDIGRQSWFGTRIMKHILKTGDNNTKSVKE